jgi:hypothetical protein
MPSARRRPIPGMTSASTAAADRPPETTPQRADEAGLGPEEHAPAPRSEEPSSGPPAPREASEVPGPRRRPTAPSSASAAAVARRRPSTDYASTRLVNFRIPVDLHDRYKQLVREVEQTHLRLRHPSLTEVLIGLLEEGPGTADEIAAVIRRKRASEHGTEDDA